MGVTLYYEGAWWDNSIKCRVDAEFHILESVVIFDQEVRRTLRARQQPLPLSSFTWNKVFLQSCQANNLKRLDLGVYFGLKSAISKQMYRFLDKKFHIRRDLTLDLREFALEHVGLARTYGDAGKLKAKLQPALEELEAIGFLEPMTPAERYSKTGRGAWNIRLVRKRTPPAEAKPAEAKPPEPEPEPTGLEKELVERGVTRSVAADLVRDFPADRITAQLERVDWLRETKPKRVKDLGAYLAKAIREEYAAPAGFEGRAERAARETARREVLDREVAARQATARAGGAGPSPGVLGGVAPGAAGGARRRGAGQGRPRRPRGVRGGVGTAGPADAPGRPARCPHPTPARPARGGLTRAAVPERPGAPPRAPGRPGRGIPPSSHRRGRHGPGKGLPRAVAEGVRTSGAAAAGSPAVAGAAGGPGGAAPGRPAPTRRRAGPAPSGAAPGPRPGSGGGDRPGRGREELRG